MTWKTVLAWPLLLGAATGSLACSKGPEEGVRIGLLLPRTGQLADSGGHAEAAALMAAESVNLAGGVGGKPITLVLKDTRSELKAGIDAAKKLLGEHELRGIIGPEEEDVATALVGLARAQGVVQISGGVSSPKFTTIEDGGFFFRTCPSSNVTATALVQRMLADGVRTASMIYVSNDFGSTFAVFADVAFRDKGGTLISDGVAGPVSVVPGSRDYRSLLRPLLERKPQALVLITDPITGAQLVSDWRLLGGTGRIYLAPNLMTQVFVQQAPAGALEGAVGVSPLSGDPDGAFAEAYEAFTGDPPAQSAYFYYDALALLALALEKARHDAGGEPTGDQIRAAVAQVANPPGEPVRWDQLGRALELLRQGADVDYVGASGAMDFDGKGDVVLEHVEYWSVRASEIVR
ncbi:MAG TPA: ABC transporter substrate-binding protein [Myxococcales bacterium]|jgi:ABC-type branched-subunit amino acid transport system substrate-binding protein